MKNWQSYLLIFIIGALLGMFYDFIHVYYNVLYYIYPHFCGESYWVFPEFGLAAVQFVFCMDWVTQKYGQFKVTSLQNCFYAFLLLLIGYLITGIFVGNNLLTLLLLLPLAILTLVIHRDKRERIVILLTAIVGPACEMLISLWGFFNYSFGNPVIPYWLPVLWIIAAGLFLETTKLLLQQQRIQKIR